MAASIRISAQDYDLTMLVHLQRLHESIPSRGTFCWGSQPGHHGDVWGLRRRRQSFRWQCSALLSESHGIQKWIWLYEGECSACVAAYGPAMLQRPDPRSSGADFVLEGRVSCSSACCTTAQQIRSLHALGYPLIGERIHQHSPL